MNNDQLRNKKLHEKRCDISAQGLQGRQSVRATFKLPEEIIQLLGIVARQLGLKQKSLFDQLIDNADVLKKIAVESGSTVVGKVRRPKTYVLSRKSLEILNGVALLQNIPRDTLVEISIQRLLPIMTAEQEKHQHRIQLHRELQNYKKNCQRLYNKSARLLGRDDKATGLIENVLNASNESLYKLEILLETGEAVENYR